MNKYLHLPQGGFGPKKRPPLRTLKELAEELGSTPNALARELNISKIPTPERRLLSKGVVTASWYEPKEFRAWWIAHKEFKKAA